MLVSSFHGFCRICLNGIRHQLDWGDRLWWRFLRRERPGELVEVELDERHSSVKSHAKLRYLSSGGDASVTDAAADAANIR
jgi:hypothetical protein